MAVVALGKMNRAQGAKSRCPLMRRTTILTVLPALMPQLPQPRLQPPRLQPQLKPILPQLQLQQLHRELDQPLRQPPLTTQEVQLHQSQIQLHRIQQTPPPQTSRFLTAPSMEKKATPSPGRRRRAAPSMRALSARPAEIPAPSADGKLGSEAHAGGFTRRRHSSAAPALGGSEPTDKPEPTLTSRRYAIVELAVAQLPSVAAADIVFASEPHAWRSSGGGGDGSSGGSGEHQGSKTNAQRGGGNVQAVVAHSRRDGRANLNDQTWEKTEQRRWGPGRCQLSFVDDDVQLL